MILFAFIQGGEEKMSRRKITIVIAIIAAALSGPASFAQSSTPNVPTIAAMQALGTSSPSYPSIIVTGQGGGLFNWISGTLPCNATAGGGDGGTTFCAGTSGSYVTSGYWERQYNGPMNIVWFGATDGGGDDTTAIQAALNTGKDVYCPPGTYTVSSNVFIQTAWQQMYGSGWGTCEIDFSLGSAGDGFSVKPSSVPLAIEHVRLANMFFKGVSNTTNLLSVGGPLLQIDTMRFQNTVANSVVINLPNENTHDGLFTFGLQINNTSIAGPLSNQSVADSGCGVKYGNNSQVSTITQSVIEHLGNGVCYAGANTGSSIDHTTFEFFSDAGYAIWISAGSTPAVYNLALTNDYCEQCQHVLLADNADLENLVFDNWVVSRSSGASISGSCVICDGPNAYGGDQANTFTNINAAGYEAIFNLNSTTYFARSIISTKGDVTNSQTPSELWSTGTYKDYALESRIANPSLINPVVTSGSITSRSINRIELAPNSTTGTEILIPLNWASGEVAERVQFYFTPVGSGNSVSATVVSLDSSVFSATPVTIATLSASGTQGIKTINLTGVAAIPNSQYYLDVVASGGTTNYINPIDLLLRQ